MAEESSTDNPLFSNPLVYQLPYAGQVRKGMPFVDEARLFDLYLPEQADGPSPVVVLVTGYPDTGFEAMTGRKQMQIQANRDWARLLAASGMAAVLYSNTDPVEDARALIAFLRAEAAQLEIDPDRIGIWSCSGNVPNAIHLIHQDDAIRCATLLYGFMLDKEGGSGVQETSETFRFANPNRGMENFPENTPILVIGAGKDDFPNLNESIDDFEAEAIARNSPVSVIRYPEGVHAFDILDDSERSKELVKLCIGFLRLRLNVY